MFMYVYVYVYVHVYIYVCMYVCMCACYLYIYVYVCLYVGVSENGVYHGIARRSFCFSGYIHRGRYFIVMVYIQNIHPQYLP